VTDKRRIHGDATRNRIMVAARSLTAVHGLEGVTVGRLAEATGLSKAGVFAHYGSKEALQAAVVEQALGEFEQEVLAPALDCQAGLPRLRAFVDRYLGLVCDEATPGGCFFTAAGIEFEHRPGRIHDRLDEIRSSWFELAAAELRAARSAGDIDEAADLDQLAFELVILLQGTNLAFQMDHDPVALERGRRAIADRLDRAGA
jgi:AcrR family transcriptional regulator